MKYKLPRPIISEDVIKIVSREVKKQNLGVIRATKNNLKEISKISQIIEKSGLPEYLVCKKLPHGLGYGIFLHPTAQPILKGQVIAPYSGEISLVPQNVPDDSAYAFSPLSDIHFTKKEQLLFDPKRRFHPQRLYSLNVDAVKKGNFTRFINHSEKPNIIAELFKIPPNVYGLSPSPIEVVYLAKKTIRPGEQLLVCYEGEDKSYWSALKIKPVPIIPTTFKLDASLKIIDRLG